MSTIAKRSSPPSQPRPAPDVSKVLEYLNQEMKIMGVLSGALGAAFLFLAKQLLFEATPFPERDLAVPLALAVAALGLACLFFYLQRSQLAWCFGQIALATAGEGDISKAVGRVDRWMTWLHYRLGFVAIFTGVTAVVAAFVEKSKALSGVGLVFAVVGGTLGLVLGIAEYIILRVRQHRGQKLAQLS